MELKSWVSPLCPREGPRQCLNGAGSVASSRDKLSREISGFGSNGKRAAGETPSQDPDSMALGSSESPL